MPKLSDAERQAMIDALAADDDDADDFEVEIFNSDGAGARVPMSKASGWLAKNFPGLDVGPAATTATEGDQGEKVVAPLRLGGAGGLFRGRPGPSQQPAGQQQQQAAGK